MRTILPKITAILLGAVFFLVSASTAFGAEFFFNFQEKSFISTSNPLLVAGPYPDAASCESGRQIKENDGFNTFICKQYASLQEAQGVNAQAIINYAKGGAPAMNTGEGDQEDAIMKQLNCNPLGAVWGEGTFADCIPELFYYILYKPSSYLLMGSGYIFDVLLSTSIRGPLVAPSFIDATWTVTRDFANMLFIFVLLYTGIMTMFGAADWRKTVLWVVVIALILNFSLFFSKVIIDAGNTLTVLIESSISSTSISEGLAGGFQPQSFLRVAGKVNPIEATIVFLVATILSGFAAYIFLQAAILFARRLIVFWALMILSPFAFVSMTLPGSYNVFGKWLKELTNQAFVAPMFLFFIYLIMQVIYAGNGLLGNFDRSGSIVESLLGPVIAAILIIKALQEALKFAERMAGDTGAAFSGLVGSAIGLAGGAALGGAALGGRAIGGKLADTAFKSGTMQRLAGSDNAFARNLGMRGTLALDTARTASWDARNVKVAGKGIKEITGLDVGKAGGKGGYVEQEKEWLKEQKKNAALMEMTDDEKKAIEAKYDVSAKEKAKEVHEALVKEQKATELAAREARVRAEREAKESPEGIALTAMSSQLKTQEAAAQKATAEREAAQKAAETSLDQKGAQAALADAVVKEQQALNAVKTTQTLVEKANTEYATNAGKKVEDADKALKEAKEKLAETKKSSEFISAAAKEAKAKAEKEIKEKNEGRRETYAGAKWTGSAVTHEPISKARRQAAVAAIRKGEKEKSSEDKIKELIKEESKKQAESGEGEVADTKKSAEPSH